MQRGIHEGGGARRRQSPAAFALRGAARSSGWQAKPKRQQLPVHQKYVAVRLYVVRSTQHEHAHVAKGKRPPAAKRIQQRRDGACPAAVRDKGRTLV